MMMNARVVLFLLITTTTTTAKKCKNRVFKKKRSKRRCYKKGKSCDYNTTCPVWDDNVGQCVEMSMNRSCTCRKNNKDSSGDKEWMCNDLPPGECPPCEDPTKVATESPTYTPSTSSYCQGNTAVDFEPCWVEYNVCVYDYLSCHNLNNTTQVCEPQYSLQRCDCANVNDDDDDPSSSSLALMWICFFQHLICENPCVPQEDDPV